MKLVIRRVLNSLWLDTIIILLATVSVALLIFQYTANLSSQQEQLLTTIDIIIAYIFLTEFLLGMWCAENKRLHFRAHWTDLLASIPFAQFDVLRGLRLVRLFRVIGTIARLRRLIRAFRKIQFHKYLYVFAIFNILIIFSSTIFFLFEQGVNTKINTFFDAIYWALITSSTIGYGDIVPTTTGGRVITIFLTFLGLGLMGTIGGITAGLLIRKSRKEEEKGAKE